MSENQSEIDGLSESRTSVLVLGDSALVSMGLRHVLEMTPGFDVVYRPTIGDVSAELIARHQVTMAVVDAHGRTDAQVVKVRELKSYDPALSVVIVTAAHDAERLAPLVLAGADALLDVSVTPDALVAVLRLLQGNVRFVTTYELWPEILENLSSLRGGDERTSVLTPREREVYEFLRDGRTDREIAEALTLSLWTVKHHVVNILQKLELRSRREVLRV